MLTKFFTLQPTFLLGGKMKKVLSGLLAVLIICSLAVPAFAGLKKPNYAAPLYNFTGKFYSDAYELIDLDDPNFQVIGGKNITKRMYPASLTKIVSAMVVLLKTKNLKTKTTVRSDTIHSLDGTGAQVAYLWPGQKVTIEQLLYLTMIYSACDACRVMADAVGGNNKKFVNIMNAWVKSIGCKNTHFVNADGLHDANHYTTVNDLRLILKEACKNKVFIKIACTKSYRFNQSTYYHTNKMLNSNYPEVYYPYAGGIKTGYTSQANHCVVSLAKKESKRYLVICLSAPLVYVDNAVINGAFADAKKLFNWAYSNLRVKTLVKANQAYTTIPVKNGKKTTKITLCFKYTVNKLMQERLYLKNIYVRPIKMPKTLTAPVKAGQTICYAQIYYRGVFVKTIPLIAKQNVNI